MTEAAQDDRRIELTLEERDVDGNPTTLTVDADCDGLWLMFYTPDGEPWFNLTEAEGRALRARLDELLGARS